MNKRDDWTGSGTTVIVRETLRGEGRPCWECEISLWCRGGAAGSFEKMSATC